ncbi:hypothetical protein FOCG_18114 [Fusarium oxysporum f. sp. radicis-lycopersici 26381]|nr:hypothetical protein FOCG_18259 [Fusarium oxysporum f. sp. radicis-lycopersici 26381]EXL39269.1 hypothetical protein FOCG_18114 [Fusarium oxysporum f. sp. radicis-lycopersici 26381]
MDDLQANVTVTSSPDSLISRLKFLDNQTTIELLHKYYDKESITITFAFGLVIIAGLCFGGYWYITCPSLTHLPRAGKGPGWLGLGLAEAKRDFKINGRKILDEGYRKYKNGMFRVQTLNVDRVVLSPKYVEEINKKIPEDALDMADGLSERLLSPQTNLDVVFQSNLHIDVCKRQLNKSLHSLVEPIHEEASYWLAERIPLGSRTEVRAYETMVRIIAATASRMLGGKSCSRNPEWLETAALYSMDVVSVAVKLRPYPAFLRPFITPWLEGTKKLKRHLEAANDTFSETISRRLQVNEQQQDQEMINGKTVVDKPVDMVQWLVDSAAGSDRDAGVLSHNMLFMSLAAVHTSSATTIHALFDLCAHPEYIEPIRNEVETEIANHGWTLSAIANMKKLDSFIKESQRLNQAVLMTFNRKVARVLRFEDGTTLGPGTYITMPSDSVSRDPDIYDDPERFDGYRFYERRKGGGRDTNRHQFASTGPESLAFGQGKNACPGRFFAGMQIKVVLANVLINYDISFPPGQTERPKNLYKGGLVRPDPRQKLLFLPRGCKTGSSC